MEASQITQMEFDRLEPAHLKTTKLGRPFFRNRTAIYFVVDCEAEFCGENQNVLCQPWAVSTHWKSICRNVVPFPSKLFAAASNGHFLQQAWNVVSHTRQQSFQVCLPGSRVRVWQTVCHQGRNKIRMFRRAVACSACRKFQTDGALPPFEHCDRRHVLDRVCYGRACAIDASRTPSQHLLKRFAFTPRLAHVGASHSTPL
jgi:hypothetical protein